MVEERIPWYVLQDGEESPRAVVGVVHSASGVMDSVL